MSEAAHYPPAAGGQDIAPARADSSRAALTELIQSFDRLCYQRQFHGLGRMPNFVGVGAGRTGTTTLYTALRRHPQIYMSPVKEINYFGVRESSIRPNGLDRRDYALYFAGGEEYDLVGEISPIYLTHGSAARSMREQLGGETKIIVQLREPVSRLVSQFFHHLDQHKVDDLDEYVRTAIATHNPAVRRQTQWFKPAKALDQSLYAEAVEAYFELFGPDHVLVLLYEDLKENPTAYLNKVCQFLGVDTLHRPLRAQNRANYARGPRRRLSPQVEAELRAYFAPDLERLEQALQTSLDIWRSKDG